MAQVVVKKRCWSLCQFSRSDFLFRGCGRFCQCNKPLSFILIRVFSIFQYLFLPTLNSSLHFASNELFSKRQENSSPATHFLVWNFSDGFAILGGWLGWIAFVGLDSRFTSTNRNRNTFNFIFVNPFFLSQTLTRSRRKALIVKLAKSSNILKFAKNLLLNIFPRHALNNNNEKCYWPSTRQ